MLYIVSCNLLFSSLDNISLTSFLSLFFLIDIFSCHIYRDLSHDFLWFCKNDKSMLRALLLFRIWLFVTLWTVVCQDSLSMGFSRQKYWSKVPSPPPGDLPNPGIKPTSPCIGRQIIYHWAPGKPLINLYHIFLKTILNEWIFGLYYEQCRGFPGSSAGKESASMQESPVRFLGLEGPLEKG